MYTQLSTSIGTASTPARAVGRPRTRPRLEDVGVHGLTRRIVALQLLLAALLAASLPVVGLSIRWTSALPVLFMDAALLLLWIYLWRVPGRPHEWIVSEAVMVLLLTLVLTQILGPAQYAAAALERPLVDATLAAADRAMGVDVSAMAAWTRRHPRINFALGLAYSTFLPQLAALVAILGVIVRDRRALWEYLFHFHVCATVTILSLALFPAACAFQYYGFESTLDQTRFIAHFNGLRDGTMTVVRYDDLEGLISMPSFHVAGALMVLWALRRHRRYFFPLCLLNALLSLATVMSGAHYVVDLAGTAAMFGGSVLAWRRWGEKLAPWDSRAA